MIVRQQICLDIFPRTGQTKPWHARDFSNQSLFDPSQPVGRQNTFVHINSYIYARLCVCACTPKRRINLGKRRPSCIIHFSPPPVALDYGNPSSCPSSDPSERDFDFLTYLLCFCSLPVLYNIII